MSQKFPRHVGCPVSLLSSPCFITSQWGTIGPMAPLIHLFYQRRLTRERVVENFYMELTIAKMGRASAKVSWPQGKVTKCLIGPCYSVSCETRHLSFLLKSPFQFCGVFQLRASLAFLSTFCFSNKLLCDAAATGPQTTFWGARQHIYNFPSLLPFLFLWPTNKSPLFLKFPSFSNS